MLKKLLGFIAIGAVAIIVTALPTFTTQAFAGVPLPSGGFKIAPTENVDPMIGRFYGKWAGSWDGRFEANLIIEKVKNDNSVIGWYCWGDSPRSNVQGGCTRLRDAKLSGDYISFSLNTRKYEFRLIDGGVLRGTSSNIGAGTSLSATMSKES